jgi:hypothetical protein
MLENVFETIEGFIKGVAVFCLLLVAAIAALFVLYFCALSAYRLANLCWDVLFSHSWSP